MFKIKETLGLSDKGHEDLKRGVRACVLSHLTLLLPFIVIIQCVIALLDPLLSGEPLDASRLWALLAAGLAAGGVYLLAYRDEYRKTFTSAYGEAERIRVEVAERMRRLPLSFFNDKDLSELTVNIMADCTSVEHVMSHVAPGLFGGAISVAITSAMLAFYDWRMALALFIPLPVSFGVIALSRNLQARFGERHVQAKLGVSGQVQEYLEGIKVVKAFGLSGERSRALESSLRKMMREAIKFEGVAAVFVTAAMMILQAGLGLVVLAGVTLLSGGTLGVVALLTFVIISARVYSPLIVMLALLPEFFYMLVSTRRMRELRGVPPMRGDESGTLESFGIELENVSFAYHEGEDVIKNVSLKIPQNGVTALVGPSGSGKTTISRLIARFWDVSGGEIRIGGRDIREIDPERLMSHMSFVFQDVVLFNDTVANNIRVGKSCAADEEVREAAARARCDEFISALPDGYDTVIGENGSTLSGGERQRLSIARALLKDAPILLLDEATASLDPENESSVQEAISELIKDRTVIVIAHRLRTVLGAEKTAVLDGGRLVEEGSGADLIKQGGLFAKLYKTQQESLGWTVRRARSEN